MLGVDNATKGRPAVDEIAVRISDTRTNGVITPYPSRSIRTATKAAMPLAAASCIPVAHWRRSEVNALTTDISTGHVWRVDYAAMVRADDGDPTTMATLYEVPIAWNDPHDTPDSGRRTYPTLFPIAQTAYRFRGGGILICRAAPACQARDAQTHNWRLMATTNCMC